MIYIEDVHGIGSQVLLSNRRLYCLRTIKPDL